MPDMFIHKGMYTITPNGGGGGGGGTMHTKIDSLGNSVPLYITTHPQTGCIGYICVCVMNRLLLWSRAAAGKRTQQF